jgi:hypothetical protein
MGIVRWQAVKKKTELPLHFQLVDIIRVYLAASVVSKDSAEIPYIIRYKS